MLKVAGGQYITRPGRPASTGRTRCRPNRSAKCNACRSPHIPPGVCAVERFQACAVSAWCVLDNDGRHLQRKSPVAYTARGFCGLAWATSGREGGIRTHGNVATTPDFESGTFDRSATSPGARAQARNYSHDSHGLQGLSAAMPAM